jgi:hypothetical protein
LSTLESLKTLKVTKLITTATTKKKQKFQQQLNIEHNTIAHYVLFTSIQVQRWKWLAEPAIKH